MRRTTFLLFCFLVALLSGCANLTQNSGFEVRSKSISIRQEPWHGNVLTGDTRATYVIAVAFVPLTQPLPQEWMEEFVDPARTYLVQTPKGGYIKKILERAVFRAISYTSDGVALAMYDAVINPDKSGIFVLFPPEKADEIQKEQLVILPSDATWLMTTKDEIVSLTEGQSLSKLPQGFFEAHPSPINEVISMSRLQIAGKYFLEDLERQFPDHFLRNGMSYSGRPDARMILAKFTSLEGGLDRAISCGTLTLTPGLTTVGLVISAAETMYAATKRDCYH